MRCHHTDFWNRKSPSRSDEMGKGEGNQCAPSPPPFQLRQNSFPPERKLASLDWNKVRILIGRCTVGLVTEIPEAQNSETGGKCASQHRLYGNRCATYRLRLPGARINSQTIFLSEEQQGLSPPLFDKPIFHPSRERVLSSINQVMVASRRITNGDAIFISGAQLFRAEICCHCIWDLLWIGDFRQRQVGGWNKHIHIERNILNIEYAL
ncbi:hypothetical protein AVEN_76683-1 [Araneus ventricosus]|uniref:Uncharacterized protein n=1 Tax=Araneus ventricosus TaxID=182803 RepID=A0A4Y2BRM6_ARAVE|nr:hypothetical protein AVEN_76683-1 [Araneus ventricosus]